MTMTATNYHNEQTEFKAGSMIKHVTDDGNIYGGKIISIDYGKDETPKVFLEIEFEDGAYGVEKSSTCF